MSAANAVAVASLQTLAVVVLLLLILAVFISRSLTRPQRELTAAMAEGDLMVNAPGQDRGDEISDMARMSAAFLDSMIDAERVKEAVAERETAQIERRRATQLSLSEAFENTVGGVIHAVNAASEELHVSANPWRAWRGHLALRPTGLQRHQRPQRHQLAPWQHRQTS
jgi:methyl-accepting chemotaxis protein